MRSEAQKEADKRYKQTPMGKKSAARTMLRYRTKAKVDVLTHYGNGALRCVRCGEEGIDCLTIDHIKPLLRRRRINPGYFYMWLRKNEYPSGYQTLCMNCQWKKRASGKEYTHFSYK